MALRIRLTETPSLSRTDLTEYYRDGSLTATTNAEEGSTAISSIIFDDPTGVLAIPGHHVIEAWDDEAAAGEEVIGRWATTIRTWSRTNNLTGVGRQWDVQMDDWNGIFHRRILTGSDANRPAETDVERMQWLHSTSDLAGVPDSTYFSTDLPADMDAADYRGQYVAAVADDCAQAAQKNWFVYMISRTATISTSSTANPTTITVSAAHDLGSFKNYVTITGHSSTPNINGEWLVTPTGTTTFTVGINVTSGGTGGTARYYLYGLWYGKADEVVNVSSLAISNVAADVDNSVTFAPALDSTMGNDPTRIYSTIVVPYSGGSVTVTDAEIATDIVDRDIVAPSVNVKTAAKATARGQAYLEANRADEQIIHTDLLLPATHVNKVMAGQVIPVTFTDFDISVPTNTRLLNRTVTQETPHLYRVAMDLEVLTLTPTACVPVQSAYTDNNFNTAYDVVLGAAPTENNTLVAILWAGSDTWVPTTISGGSWTLRASGYGRDAAQYGGPGNFARLVVYTRLAGAGESATITITPDTGFTACMIVEIPGTYASVTTSGNVTKTAGQELSVSRTSTGAGLVLAAWAMQRTTYAPQDSIATTTATEIRDRWRTEEPAYAACHTWVAWTNTAEAATMTITGAPNANPNLDRWGIFAAGLLFDCN